MTNLWEVFKLAQTNHLQEKGDENIRTELASLLDTYLKDFSVVYHEKIENAVHTVEDLLVIKSIAFWILKTRLRDFKQLEQEVIDASQYVWIGDSAYPNYCILFEKISLQINDILEGKDAIERQIEVLKRYMQAKGITSSQKWQPTIKELSIHIQKKKKKQNKRTNYYPITNRSPTSAWIFYSRKLKKYSKENRTTPYSTNRSITKSPRYSRKIRVKSSTK